MITRFHREFMSRTILVIVFLSAMVLGTASAAFKYLQEGMTPPEFKGKDLITGEEIVWKPGTGDEGSEVALIVFWATWSPRSMDLLRDLKTMAEQYKDHNFRVIAVNVDGQEPSPTMMREISRTSVELDLPFPIIVDEGLKTFYAYGVIAVPSIALVDGSGHLRYGPSGYSYTIKDRIIDSTEVLLGLREVDAVASLTPVYRPKPKASRYYHLGRKLAGKRLYERALGNLDKAVEEDAGFSSPFNLKGQIQLAMGNLEEAERNFARSVELDNTSVAAMAGWGRSLLLQDRNEEAAVKLAAALDLDDTYTPALVDLAECRTREGKLEEAWDLYQAARDLNPRNPELLFHLGRFLRQKGEASSAVAVYKTAIEQLVTLPILESAPQH
ncbi:MAG: tetratricopeptide repeat protein [Candidatus Krumholzibacteriota bacterium]